MAGYSTPAWSNGESPAISAGNLTAMGQGIELAQHPYGVCQTPAATAAKVVALDYSGTLALFTGLTVRVKFSNSNTAANPTLNVNGTGAKAIKSYGSANATTWMAGQVIEFVYDGTNWLFDGIDAYTKGQSLSEETAAAIKTATGTKPATPDEALALLATGVGNVKLATGTYVGTGTFGQANPNTLTFSFVPKMVIVGLLPWGLAPLAGSMTTNSWSDSFLWMTGQTITYVREYQCIFAQTGNTLSWYSSVVTAQLNANGATYSYIALG